MEYSQEERAIIGLCMAADESRLSSLARALAEIGLPSSQKICVSVIEKAAKRVYKDEPLPSAAEQDAAIARLEALNMFAVTLVSADYPASLRVIPDPPPVLYGMGRRELLARRKFCIVGSRILPAWAEKTGKTIAADLSRRFVIVTGIAEGGDRAAIDGALAGGNLICVLPNGPDVAYPAAHASLQREVARRGLLLSEYAPGVKTKKYAFHARNRILAGLSDGVLILAAGARSGTLITANCALEYGRELFALPHNVGVAQGEGCNEMIKAGAWLCTCAGDVFAAYGMTAEEKPRIRLSEKEERLLAVLKEAGELHAAVLAERVGLPVFEAQAILASLEMKGLAVRSGGNRFSAI